MKAILIGTNKCLDSIRQGTKAVALTFRPSGNDIMEIIKKGKNIKTIFIEPSQIKTLGKTTVKFAEIQGISIMESPKKFQGTRIDINGPEIEIEDELLVKKQE
jgi:hypothetical protein